MLVERRFILPALIYKYILDEKMLRCVFLTSGDRKFSGARNGFFPSLACLLPETRELRECSVFNGVILKIGSMYRNYDESVIHAS